MLYLLAALATWRITHILLRENGPWRVFRRLRVALGVTYYDDDDPKVSSFRYEITVCVWCLSVWTGSVATAILMLVPEWLQYVLFTPFAISAVCVIVDSKFGLK